MKNDIIDCMEYIDPELIAEAEEYSVSEQNKSLYYIIPAAAACAALVITVNHFTNLKNIREPEIDNSVVSEVTTTNISDTETGCGTTAYFSENESEKISGTDSSAYTEKSVTTAETSETTTLKYFPAVTSASEISSVSDTSVISDSHSVTTAHITTERTELIISKVTTEKTSATSKVNITTDTSMVSIPESTITSKVNIITSTSPVSVPENIITSKVNIITGTSQVSVPENIITSKVNIITGTSAEFLPLTGDINNDRVIDLLDLSELSFILLSNEELTEVQKKSADVDRNGKIDLADLARLKQYIFNL